MKRILLVISLIVVFSVSLTWGATQEFKGNITGNAATVTTNANLTGDVTSAGNATTVKESLAIQSPTLSPGSEKITNGGFDPDTEWTKEAGWTISGGYAVATAAAHARELSQATSVVSGRAYLVVFTVSGFTGGGVFPVIGGVTGLTHSSDGTKTQIIVAGAGGIVKIQCSGETTLNIDNFSVKEVPLTINGDAYLTGNMRVVIPTYANNAAALAGGLVAGQLYRVNAATDPEPLYVVH